MGALAVVGLILIVVGILGLFEVLKLGLALAIVLCVVGIVALIFSRDTFIRR